MSCVLCFLILFTDVGCDNEFPPSLSDLSFASFRNRLRNGPILLLSLVEPLYISTSAFLERLLLPNSCDVLETLNWKYFKAYHVFNKNSFRKIDNFYRCRLR